MARRAVQIDHQARISRHDGGRVQGFRQDARNAFGADVIGDMTVEMRGVQAQVVEGPGNSAAGMIAGQNQAGAGAGVEAHGGGRFVGGQQRRGRIHQ